mmetsp:Transcript_6386/g.14433  ORF Transcript_6386/g.14433 Transcript_6386/m.14433 type:complete len:227 (-) Transcript_6386:8-688(-)
MATAEPNTARRAPFNASGMELSTSTTMLKPANRAPWFATTWSCCAFSSTARRASSIACLSFSSARCFMSSSRHLTSQAISAISIPAANPIIFADQRGGLPSLPYMTLLFRSSTYRSTGPKLDCCGTTRTRQSSVTMRPECPALPLFVQIRAYCFPEEFDGGTRNPSIRAVSLCPSSDQTEDREDPPYRATPLPRTRCLPSHATLPASSFFVLVVIRISTMLYCPSS